MVEESAQNVGIESYKRLSNHQLKLKALKYKLLLKLQSMF